MVSTGNLGFLLLVTGSIGVLLVLALLLKKRPASYYLFAANVLFVAWSAILLSVIKTKWLLYFPHLLLTPSPFHYLIGPFCLFFVRFSINPYFKLKWLHLLHLLPFVLHVIELFPFFSLGTEEKLKLIVEAYNLNAMAVDNFSYQLPYFTHIFFKTASIFIYGIVGFLIITQSSKGVMPSFRQHNHLIYRWVRIETILKINLGFFGIIWSVRNHDSLNIDLIYSGVVGLDSIVSFGFIILNPRILEGTNPAIINLKVITFPTPVFEDIEKKDSHSESITDAAEEIVQNAPIDKESVHRNAELFNQVESIFQTHKPFLREDFSKDILSKKIGLPGKKISEQIRLATGLSFPDYVNSYRLRFLEENTVSHPEWKKFTIDAISADLGFSNRISFYNAVKRLRGVSPSELLKSLGLGERN